MTQGGSKESWVDIDWKNRDDPRYENLTPDVRDSINSHIFNGFIGEKGGKGWNISNRLHLEFTKSPSKKEAEAWEHRTRFRSVLVRAIVEIDAPQIRVIYVDSAEVKNDSLVVKGSKEQGWRYTLYCLPSDFKVAYELYEGSPYQRVGPGVLKFASKDQIGKRIGHYEMVSMEKKKMEATFEVSPISSGKADSVIFEDEVLVYSKQAKGFIEIDSHATESQKKTYGSL